MSEATASGEGDPPQKGLRARASQGAMLSLLGQGTAQVLRLAGNLVLARMLFPEAFGLMAIVYLIVFALEQFSNIGIPAAIMRYERGETRAFMTTAWTLQVLRGLLLWAIGLALTPVVADFYRQPQLLQIMPVATFAAVIMGLQSTQFLVLTRRLQLKRRVAIEIIGRVTALVTMIVWAWIEASVWALVVGGLMNQVAITVLSHVWIPGDRMRFAWDRQTVAEIFSLGKWVFASSGLSFVLAQMDVALLGRLVSTAELGVYSMGILIAGLLRDVSFQVANSVLAPVVAESNREGPERLRQRYRAVRRVTLPGTLLMGLGALVVSPLFFELLYDERYWDARWIAQLALIRFWFAYLQVASCMSLLSIGEGRAWAISNLIGLVGVTTGCIVGFELGELRGLLIGMGIGSMLAFLWPAYRLWRLGVATPAAEFQYSLVGAALAAAAVLASDASAAWIPLGDSWRTLIVGSAVLLPFAAFVAHRALREFRFR